MPNKNKMMEMSALSASELADLNFEELCHSCEVTPDFVIELIEYGTIEPKGLTADTWRFGAEQMPVVRTALRLHQDLGINHPGIALVIDLMDEIEEMRKQIEVLEKFFDAKNS